VYPSSDRMKQYLLCWAGPFHWALEQIIYWLYVQERYTNISGW